MDFLNRGSRFLVSSSPPPEASTATGVGRTSLPCLRALGVRPWRPATQWTPSWLADEQLRSLSAAGQLSRPVISSSERPRYSSSSSRQQRLACCGFCPTNCSRSIDSIHITTVQSIATGLFGNDDVVNNRTGLCSTTRHDTFLLKSCCRRAIRHHGASSLRPLHFIWQLPELLPRLADPQDQQPELQDLEITRRGVSLTLHSLCS